LPLLSIGNVFLIRIILQAGFCFSSYRALRISDYVEILKGHGFIASGKSETEGGGGFTGCGKTFCFERARL
jgi:hypothetical protein